MFDSSVSDNVASLTSRNPITNPDGSTTDSLVNSGGIHVNDGSTVMIDSSRIDDNVAAVDNPQGQAAVINSGLQLIFQRPEPERHQCQRQQGDRPGQGHR